MSQLAALSGDNNISVKRFIINMELRTGKATSYRDLLQHFQQCERPPQAASAHRAPQRPLHLKRQPTPRQNKQNLNSKAHIQSTHEKSHIQSLHEKSVSQKSEWSEQQVLREYSHKRKERQLELSYNKFIAYTTHMLSNLTGAVPPELLTNKLTYLQYLAALKEMAFIRQTYEPAPHDSVAELWAEITAHAQTVGAFILFVTSILNMRKSDDESTGKFAYLAKKYVDLRFTRMELQGKVKTVQDQEEYPFTPSISQRSRTLAASRSKSKGRGDRCFAQKSCNQLLEESTQAHPESTKRCQSPSDDFLGNRRSQILYKLAKQKSLQKRRDKKSSEVEYQKSIKELTFHPKIHQPSQPKQKQPKKNIQGEQDCIDRMIRGRIEREVRKVIQEKGLPYNERMFQKMKRERYEALQRQAKNQHLTHFSSQEEPHLQMELPQPTRTPQEAPSSSETNNKREPVVLLIEVDEGHCEKLIIDDVSRYKQAAAKFIKDFNLKPEMYDKLVDGVQNALKFQLTPINEAPYQSEYESVD